MQLLKHFTSQIFYQKKSTLQWKDRWSQLKRPGRSLIFLALNTATPHVIWRYGKHAINFTLLKVIDFLKWCTWIGFIFSSVFIQPLQHYINWNLSGNINFIFPDKRIQILIKYLRKKVYLFAEQPKSHSIPQSDTYTNCT